MTPAAGPVTLTTMRLIHVSIRQLREDAIGLVPVRALTQLPGQPGARELTRRCGLPEPANCLVAKLAKPDLHGGQ